jgi:hypothetical protein
MLGRNRVVNPAKPPLQQAPESLNGIGVHVAYDVDLRCVIDAEMPQLPHSFFRFSTYFFTYEWMMLNDLLKGA